MKTNTLWKLTASILVIQSFMVFAPNSSATTYTPGERAWYQDGPKGRYLLGGSWYLRQDPQDIGSQQGWQTQVSLRDWVPTRVPKSCNADDLSDASYAGSVCWYRTDFKLPKGVSATAWALRFESVNYYAKVWINGRPLGKHQGDFLPFELLAKKIKKNGTNRLVVRVDGRRVYGSLPPADKLGWWNWYGINREVYLRRIGKLDVSNVTISPTLPCPTCTATILTQITVRNHTDHDQQGISGTITGPESFKRTLKFSRKTFPARKFATVKSKIKVASPSLWSPATPSLYRVTLRLGDPAKPGGQSLSYHFGIRRWQVDQLGRMLLNGKQVNLRGAAIHEYAPGVGAGLSPRHHLINIKLLKKLYANFTRVHYPLHPYFLEQADKNGIVVWDEVPFYQLNGDYLEDADIRQRGVNMVKEMVRRDQTHASVMSYSIFNELPSRPDQSIGQRYYIIQACKAIKAIDPSGLCAAAIPGYPNVPAQRGYRPLDVLGLNLYFGWYQGGSTGQLSDRNSLPGYLDQAHNYYPDKALFATEFGAEAGCKGEPSVKGTYEFQNDWLSYTLDAIDSKDFIDGALVWALKNFMVKPGWAGGATDCTRPPQHQKGLLDAYGQRKPSFDIMAQRFAQTPWSR